MNPRLLASLTLGGATFLAGTLATGAEPTKPRPTAAITQSGMGGAVQPVGESRKVSRDGKREFAPRGSDCGVPGVPSYLISLGSPSFVPFKRTTSVSIPDTVQLVFLARVAPVRIELKVQGAGMSLNQRWETNLKKLFTAFDRDGDGYLNRHEVERIFSKNEFRQVVQGGYAFRGQGSLPTLEALDRDGDNRVSFEEMADYYETEVNAILKMRVTAVPNYNQQADQITPELFARFDTNEDGKLSEAELKNAERIILPLDANEDECVSAAEILATPFRKQIVAVPGVGAGMAMNAMPGMAGPNGQTPAAPTEFQAHLETLPGNIVQQLFKKYDKNGDFLLTREEIGFSPEKFARLDLNKDGKLSATELDAWRNGAPDLTLTLSLGPNPTDATIKASPEKGTRDITVAVEENRTILLVGTQPLDIAPFSIPTSMQQQQRNPYSYVFPQGKDFVTEEDLAGPQNQFLRVLFEPADFNGDGRLTREEFESYFAIQRQTGELGLSLSHVTRMPNFFQLLDQNGDGKLSARELRTAYRRIISLEPTGGKEVTRAILQPSVVMRVGPTQVAAYDPSLYNNNQGMNAVSEVVPTKGPLWFRKMDRNGDGDVSRIEFLGTKEQFDAIDANKDGLITLEEAETFDKRQPKKK